MARYQHLKLYQGLYTYSREILRARRDLPKMLRHELGQALFASCLRCFKLIVFANGHVVKEKYLRDLYLELETHWVMWRILCDENAISKTNFGLRSEQLSNLQKQTAGWLKWEQNKVDQKIAVEKKS
jgi:hypothetical protein